VNNIYGFEPQFTIQDLTPFYDTFLTISQF